MTYEELEKEYFGKTPEIKNHKDYRYQMILIRKTVLWFLIENKGKEIAVADIIEYLNSKQIYLGAKTLYNNYLSFYIRKGLITQIKNWGLMNYRFKVNKWENE